MVVSMSASETAKRVTGTDCDGLPTEIEQAWVRGFCRAYAIFGDDAPLDPVPYLPSRMRDYGRLVWGPASFWGAEE